MHFDKVSSILCSAYACTDDCGYRYVCEFYARGKSYEEVHERNRLRKPQWEKYIEGTSFKFMVTAFNHTIPQWRQKDVVESFSYMDFQGKIDMKNPDITLACFEECMYHTSFGCTVL